ncbi:2-methylaconitate cis-trans isomerase PrpF family protein [Terribacillus sp. AE2B 122]|uniref:2-methylaconitate cis-trans isomerase PrpF family protein n=1 Tax=Terribacillus sp. AE2B 122 TaxID=1331902 RepID=UPI0015820A2F|nr:PrpF domain-containing protein [Terribacillus sp. AE2B 122]
MEKIRIVYMRGGTSKGVFLHETDMPAERENWTPFLLDLMGSPDKRQIDGLGGANSLTSKAAIIRKAESDKDFDVYYTFAQVSITDETVDMNGNCGNISSAVGPFAIQEGLVSATEPITTVRIWNTNTQKLILAEVAVKDGDVQITGSTAIPGVPGYGSEIALTFCHAEGSVTGELLPTGNVTDVLETSFGSIVCSIVDAANPLVFVEAAKLGIEETILPDSFTETDLQRCEEIRSVAAELCGFTSRDKATKLSPAVPKLALIGKAKAYTDTNKNLYSTHDMDIHLRMLSMQRPHEALAITGAICTTAACAIPGTLPHTLAKKTTGSLRIAHPSGITETAYASLSEIKVIRTARRILEGTAYVKQNYNFKEVIASKN